MKISVHSGLTTGLLATCLLAFPKPAAAHFVWVEPATSPGAVRVYFGEYPDGREGSPLLEKVQRVRVHAVGGSGKQELKQLKQEDHYLYEGMGSAPVAIAALDYGMLERPGTPPFLLRYEAQLIRGEGKPLSAADLGRWSRLETGLPLSATLTPAAPGKLALSVALDGKPVAAEVTRVSSTESEKLKTSPEGRLELPAAGGWHHLRIMAQDAKPARFEGKDGQFTRTYLWVMFELAPEAAGAAAGAVKPDGEAVRLLNEAHAARANWGPNFPGFTADAEYSFNGRKAKGTITVGADFKIAYALGDPELEKKLGPSFGSLIMHRQSGGTPEYAATWRDSETHPLGRAVNLNDQLGSFYRLRDRQILQVNRKMGTQRFTNDVLENEQTKLGFLPRAWTVAYYANDTNQLVRVSTTRVTWTWQGDVFLPATLRTSAASGEGTDSSELILTNHRLLK